ncbi:MAG TPA: D-galactarate dehydratase [Euryarchaeota archaeon]|nr:D-galactarate dehydratase [Euryarchaeota archaeon]
MNERDNVATALCEIRSGERISVRNGEEREIEVIQDIPFGHKFAIREIQKGEHIIKYGEIIGRALADIRKGEHVHVHNIESLRGRGDLTSSP